MPTVLQNIGASKAGTSLADHVAQQRRLKVYEGRLGLEKELGEARMESLETSTNVSREQLKQMRQKFAEDNKPIPFEILKNKAKSPEAGNYAESLARELGYINKDGTIKAKHARELSGYLHTMPAHVQNLSDMALIRAQKEYETLAAAKDNPELMKKLKLKPEEFAQKLKQAETAYTVAQGRSTAFTTSMKTMLAQQQARVDALNKQAALAQGERRISETERHNKAMEGLRKSANQASYKLTDLKLNTWSKYFAEADSLSEQEKQLIGVDVDPFLRSSVSIVMSDLGNLELSSEEKLTKILEMSEVLRSASSWKSPEKKQVLPEEIYKFYENKGKTREQVDKAYRKKYGSK